MDLSDALYRLTEIEDVNELETLLEQIEGFIRQSPMVVHARRGDEQTTWLHTAVDYRLHHVAAILIRYGANPDAQTAAGAAPLFHLFDDRGESQSAVQTATALLAGGANPNAVVPSGESLIYRAHILGYDVIANLLRQSGATLDLKTATVLGLSEVVGRLLADSADPVQLICNTPGLGADAIAAASFAREPDGKPIDTLQLLLQHGLNPNQIGRYNWPLVVNTLDTGHAAAQLRALVAAGADVNVTFKYNGENCTALDVILDSGHHDRDRATIDTLRSLGGKTYAELHPPPRKRRK